MRLWILIATIFSSFAVTLQAQSEPRVVGYFVSWGVYARNYHVSDIPAEKVTHINFAFANVVGGECVVGDVWADTQMLYPGDVWGQPLAGNFHQLQLLKEAHPELKTLISVGGWTWSSEFSAVCATAASRASFAASCVEFMLQYEFDGIDIDWEYPISGGLSPGVPADAQNFTAFLSELRSQLDAQEALDGNDYLLTIASAAGPQTLLNYELDLIHQYLDWINLMSYDFHGGWSPVTNFNSALYDSGEGPPGYSGWNTHSAVQAYIAAGVPREKLQIGLPFYGRGWAGVSNANDGLFQSFSGLPSGTWEAGMFDYSDVVENYVTPTTRHWHEAASVPWFYDPNTGVMISYDDEESIAAKVNYVLDEGLGGVMFWEFSGDDQNQTLVSTIRDIFDGAGSNPVDFQRGDVNIDGTFDVSDAVSLLISLFTAGSAGPACENAADGNDDSLIDIADVVLMLGALFVPETGPLPAPVGCGTDPTPGPLGCAQSACP